MSDEIGAGRVRLATEDDLPAILEISNLAARDTPANFAVEPEQLGEWTDAWRATSKTFPWLVAIDEAGACVGFAKASPHRSRGAYRWTAEVSVYVRPGHHGRGLGMALYGILIPTLRRQGYRTLIAGITIPNAASVRLHESFGFRHLGTFSRVGWKHGVWRDVGYWELTLGGADDPPDAIRTVAESSEEGT